MSRLVVLLMLCGCVEDGPTPFDPAAPASPMPAQLTRLTLGPISTEGVCEHARALALVGQRGLEACMDHEARQTPGFEGEFVLAFTVEDGAVEHVRFVGEARKVAAEARRCITRRLQRRSWPAGSACTLHLPMRYADRAVDGS